MQFKRIQEEAIYLPVSQRLDFLSTFGISYAAIFSATNLHPQGNELALWARLNRHGLLEELQKRQQTLATLKGAHEPIIDRLKLISSEISTRKGLDDMVHQQLISERESLEERLYSLLPQIQTRVTYLEGQRPIVHHVTKGEGIQHMTGHLPDHWWWKRVAATAS